MKVSFCITSMNRLHHLSETLLKNIDNNKTENCEFIVLDYNSCDGLELWIKEKVKKYIDLGIVKYYREESASCFLPSHSRNVCALLANNEIVCNLDADNFTGEGFSNFLIENFIKYKKNVIAASPYIFTKFKTSTHGRLAYFKKDFLNIGGYNEDLNYGWGGEDNDLYRRFILKKFNTIKIKENYLNFIPHEDEERVRYVNFEKLSTITEKNKEQIKNRAIKEGKENFDFYSTSRKMLSRILHESITDKNISSGNYLANVKKTWGKSFLIKNFNEKITTGYYTKSSLMF